MNGWVLFVLMTLASYRLTRLFTLDTLFDKPRGWWWAKFNIGSHPLGQLIACSWCIGWWCTGAVVGAVAWWKSVPLPLLVWPAAAVVVGFLGKLDET